MSSENKISHLVEFDAVLSVISYSVLMNCLIFSSYCLCSFHTCPVYCSSLFVFVCCALSAVGHVAVDSACQ